MKLNWGARIAVLYGGFVALIVTMVVLSSHQHFDLVSANYYADEIAYQKVIDAGKNQSSLSAPIIVHADESKVVIEFPDELKDKAISGQIQFYSPVNAAWDQKVSVNVVNNTMSVPRGKLRNTHYTVKMDIEASGKKYYQESEISLHS